MVAELWLQVEVVGSGVPLATRQDWQQLLAAAAKLADALGPVREVVARNLREFRMAGWWL